MKEIVEIMQKMAKAKEETGKRGPCHDRWYFARDDESAKNDEYGESTRIYPSGCWSQEEALRVCEEWNDKDLLDAKREGRPAHHYVVQRLNEDGTYEIVKE